MATLSQFNASLETTREWIDELKALLRTDEHRACRALRATLHELRNHLTPDEMADLAAQFPYLLRGVFYEGWRPAGKPIHEKSREVFLMNVGRYLRELPYLEDVEAVVCDVFAFLERRVSPGEIRDVISILPRELRSLWPSYAQPRMSA